MYRIPMNLIWIPSSPRCPVRRPQRRQSQCLRQRQSRKSRSSRSPHRRQRPRQRSPRRLPEIRRIKRQRRPQRPQPPNTSLLKKRAKRASRRASRKWKSVSAGPRRRSPSGRHAARPSWQKRKLPRRPPSSRRSWKKPLPRKQAARQASRASRQERHALPPIRLRKRKISSWSIPRRLCTRHAAVRAFCRSGRCWC